jgi:hypothetical protein
MPLNYHALPVICRMSASAVSGERASAHAMHAHVRKGARLQCLPLTSLVSALREVRALVNSHTLDRHVLTALLQPKASPGEAGAGRSGARMLADARVPEGLRKHIAGAYNDSQMQVRCALLHGS